MFYATIVNEIGDRGIIDAQGKRLAFIGNLPVQIGDIVFTDGNVIFGNVPRRGSINYFIEKQRGIPVLGVDLRGYFTLLGGFKSYLIAGEDWIVNSQKYYAHDVREDIIDAEISLDYDGEADGVLTAEKSVQLNSAIPNDDLFSQLPEYAAFLLSPDDCDFCNYDDNILKNCELILSNDNQTIEQIAMADFTKPYETAVSEIVAAADVTNRDIEDHLQSRAKLLNFKLDTNEQWEALILVDVCTTRTIGEQQVTALKFETNSDFNYDTIILDQEELDLSNMGLPASLLARLGNISTSLFGAYAVDVQKDFFYVSVVDGDTSTLDGKQLFPHHSFLAKVTSDNATPITLADKQYPAFYISENNTITDEEYFTFEIPWERVHQIPGFGYTPGTYWYSRESKADHRAAFQDDLPYIEEHLSQEEYDAVSGNDSYDTWTTVNSSDRIYIELVADEYSGESYAVSTRARTWLINAEYDYHFTRHTIVRIIRRKYLRALLPNGNITSPIAQAVDSFTFPAQDDYQLKIYQETDTFLENSDAEIIQGDNVIIDQSQLPDLLENPYELNLCIYPLSAGYIVGAHDKHLYTIINDVVNEVDDELKNFRLRELNPISIAKA